MRPRALPPLLPLLLLAACASEPARPGRPPRTPPRDVEGPGPTPAAPTSAVDARPPRLTITSPHDGLRTGGDHVWVRGRAVDEASTWVDVTVVAGSWRRAVRLARNDDLAERVPLEEGAATIEVVATDAAGNSARVARAVRREPGFFGLPVEADRVVFVIDTSGSMVLTDRPATFPLGEEAFRAADPRDPAIAALQRLERAKTELSAALRGLRREQRFNVLAFADEVTRWRSACVEASDDERASALSFVEALVARGQTRTRDALAAALDDPQVEAIYLLSDGAPTDVPAGGASPEDLRRAAREGIDACLALVRERLAVRRVTIHTLGMDGPGVHHARWGPRDTPDDPAYLGMLRRFLEELARLGGGTFRPI